MHTWMGRHWKETVLLGNITGPEKEKRNIQAKAKRVLWANLCLHFWFHQHMLIII